MQRPIKAGVIGCGSLALKGVLPQLAEADARARIEVVALCDVVEARVREAAAKWETPQVYTDAGALIDCVQGARSPQLELFGLGGTLAIDVLDVSAPLELQRAGSGWEQIPVPRAGRAAGPDHHLGVEHLVDCIEQRTTPVLSVEHAIHVVEIIEQAARSSVEGRVFDITNTFEPVQ